jgi:hypothetical protein
VSTAGTVEAVEAMPAALVPPAVRNAEAETAPLVHPPGARVWLLIQDSGAPEVPTLLA